MIVVDDCLTSQFTHAHDAVGIVHTVFLDRVNRRVHLSARTVEVGSMDVYAQGLATDVLGMDAGRIGQPVVRMNNVKLLGAGNHASDDRIVVDFLMQVAGIATGKLHSAQIIHMHVVEIGINMLTQLEIIVGIHHVTHAILHIVVADITPGDRHGIHGHDAASSLTLIAKRMWQTEHSLDVALCLQSFRNTIVGSCKSAKHMRRILPSKH